MRYEPMMSAVDNVQVRWYVLDTETGVQFNCNSKAHAIYKANKMNKMAVNRDN